MILFLKTAGVNECCACMRIHTHVKIPLGRSFIYFPLCIQNAALILPLKKLYKHALQFFEMTSKKVKRG